MHHPRWFQMQNACKGQGMFRRDLLQEFSAFFSLNLSCQVLTFSQIPPSEQEEV